MLLPLSDLIIFGIGAVLLVLWLFFFLGGLKYAHLFQGLDEKDWPLKEIYFVGYAVMEFIHYKYKSKSDRKLRKELSVLYGEKYAEYYIRVTYGQRMTIAMILAVVAVPMYGLSEELIMLFIFWFFSPLMYYYFGTFAEKKILERAEEMLSDFSEVISKLALLTNAGMIMREAWEEVAYAGETTIYKEMQITVTEMRNGTPEVDALYNFGTRCVIPEIKKFTATIVQGMIEGNMELTYMLQQQSKEVWSAKKQSVRRQGEQAASKLLIPILIMFIGILIMVIVPIFANLGA